MLANDFEKAISKAILKSEVDNEDLIKRELEMLGINRELFLPVLIIIELILTIRIGRE